MSGEGDVKFAGDLERVLEREYFCVKSCFVCAKSLVVVSNEEMKQRSVQLTRTLRSVLDDPSTPFSVSECAALALSLIRGMSNTDTRGYVQVLSDLVKEVGGMECCTIEEISGRSIDLIVSQWAANRSTSIVSSFEGKELLQVKKNDVRATKVRADELSPRASEVNSGEDFRAAVGRWNNDVRGIIAKELVECRFLGDDRVSSFLLARIPLLAGFGLLETAVQGVLIHRESSALCAICIDLFVLSSHREQLDAIAVLLEERPLRRFFDISFAQSIVNRISADSCIDILCVASVARLMFLDHERTLDLLFFYGTASASSAEAASALIETFSLLWTSESRCDDVLIRAWKRLLYRRAGEVSGREVESICSTLHRQRSIEPIAVFGGSLFSSRVNGVCRRMVETVINAFTDSLVSSSWKTNVFLLCLLIHVCSHVGDGCVQIVLDELVRVAAHAYRVTKDRVDAVCAVHCQLELLAEELIGIIARHREYVQRESLVARCEDMWRVRCAFLAIDRELDNDHSCPGAVAASSTSSVLTAEDMDDLLRYVGMPSSSLSRALERLTRERHLCLENSSDRCLRDEMCHQLAACASDLPKPHFTRIISSFIPLIFQAQVFDPFGSSTKNSEFVEAAIFLLSLIRIRTAVLSSRGTSALTGLFQVAVQKDESIVGDLLEVVVDFLALSDGLCGPESDSSSCLFGIILELVSLLASELGSLATEDQSLAKMLAESAVRTIRPILSADCSREVVLTKLTVQS